MGDEKTPILTLPLDQQKIYDALNIEQRETFRALDPDERDALFAIEEKTQRIEYLERKSTEIHNRAMEAMEKQRST